MDIVIVFGRNLHFTQDIIPWGEAYERAVAQLRAFHFLGQIGQVLNRNLPLADVLPREGPVFIRETYRNSLFIGNTGVRHYPAIRFINHIDLPGHPLWEGGRGKNRKHHGQHKLLHDSHCSMESIG